MSHFRALVGSDANSDSDPAAWFPRRAVPPDAQLDRVVKFDNSGCMESKTAVEALGALAQDSRLQVYRLLVQAGPEGMAASEIAERLDVPANTLSFHLKILSHAGLVLSRPEGRYIYYSANYEQMNALLGFLTENCCGGRSCVPGAAPRKRRVS
jgi:ArsR family transcriptional regulator, arsenate/arsenite/antimonite-responsive transcriptional repressor